MESVTSIDAGAYLKQYDADCKYHALFIDTWEEIFSYTLPAREGFYDETPGSRRNSEIYDETAVVGMQEFASRLQQGMTPNFLTWSELTPGSIIPPEQAGEVQGELDHVNKEIFNGIHNSNFAAEGFESYLDVAVGSGLLIMDEGNSLAAPFRFRSIPLTRFKFGAGPYNEPDPVWIDHMLTLEQIEVQWPKAELTIEMRERSEKDPQFKHKLVERIGRDWTKLGTETHTYHLISITDKAFIDQDKYTGSHSSPAIPFRWSKASGERYGRGPAWNVLPAIRVVNLTVQLILENAEMSIAGMWQTDNAGVVNADNINLVPGTIIPMMRGTQGLQPLQAGGDFRVSDLILDDMRHNIRKGMFNETLGARSGTPPSATEVDERMAELSRAVGSSFGRLKTELNDRIIGRGAHILKRKGLIELPKIDGREIAIHSTSPLARAQRIDDVRRSQNYLGLVQQLFGPKVFAASQKADKWTTYLAQLHEIPKANYNSPDEMAAQAKQAGEMMGKAEEAGIDPQVVMDQVGKMTG